VLSPTRWPCDPLRRSAVAHILNAIDRCQSYERYLRSDEFGSMAYDAVLRNIVVHEYFRVNPELIPRHSRPSAGPLAQGVRSS
jgi:uncharacterized protein with HEPN domain